MKKHEIAIGLLVSVTLLVAAHYGWVINPWTEEKLGLTETWGFVTGGWCVYMTVHENIWNFPLGIANNIFFAILFFKGALYSDMSLQGIYFVLGLLGWYWWARGGSQNSALPVGRASLNTIIACLVFVAVATLAQLPVLMYLNGKAPFFDALTTSLCLAAQFLLNRKLIQTWYFWIAADLIYIPLYVWRGYDLTALLYGAFIVLCLAGLKEWRKSLSGEAIILSNHEKMA